jgi:hypothetical protein
MSLGIERATYVSMTQRDFITIPFNAGRESEESKKAKSEEGREIERTTVTPIYDSRGKIIKDSRSDVSTENYREYLKQHPKYEPIDLSA